MLDFLDNVQGKILNLFFSDPTKKYYFREIGQKINKEPSSYQRYLEEFVDDKIFLDERRGNMRFFRLNLKHPLYKEIESMISKTLGVEYKLKNLISKLDKVECAFLFGSIAKKNENINSDIDLMIIGEPNQDLLIKGISKIESEIKREINYHIYNKVELAEKIDKKDSFFVNIFSSPIINLKGDIYEFIGTAK